jgi:hypothetical protein
MCCVLLLLLLSMPQIGSVTKDDFPLETLGPILKDVQHEVGRQQPFGCSAA